MLRVYRNFIGAHSVSKYLVPISSENSTVISDMLDTKIDLGVGIEKS